MTADAPATDRTWVDRAGGNRGGTLFFERLITLSGLRPAYAMLFFAAWQYALLDRKGAAAIRDFRSHLGLRTTHVDLYRHFHSFGMTLIDRFAFSCGLGGRFRTEHVNEAAIAAEVARKKGVILLGGHVGNWEFAGNLLTKRLGADVHVFMYGAGEGSARIAPGVVVHHVQGGASDTAVGIVNALRDGAIVCMLGDRFFGEQRTVVHDFLGEPARFPAGAMAIAAATGAAVIPCFTVRTSRYNYSFSAAEPIHVPAGRDQREEGIYSGVGRYVAVLERTCRTHPLQWYNFFRFWDKT
jgi:predicted LPLAT superfamily acyltransferase